VGGIRPGIEFFFVTFAATLGALVTAKRTENAALSSNARLPDGNSSVREMTLARINKEIARASQ
jgi:hypothetical protein